MNITLEKTDTVKKSAIDISKAAIPYIHKQADIQERAIGLLSHVLPLSTEVVEHFLLEQRR